MKLTLLEVWASTAKGPGKWKSNFSSFVKEFGNFATQANDSELVRFADRLIGYPDYMRSTDPYEFASHFLRQSQNKASPGHPYRGGGKSDPAENAKTDLARVFRLIQNYQQINPKFANFAATFFRDAQAVF